MTGQLNDSHHGLLKSQSAESPIILSGVFDPCGSSVCLDAFHALGCWACVNRSRGLSLVLCMYDMVAVS